MSYHIYQNLGHPGSRKEFLDPQQKPIQWQGSRETCATFEKDKRLGQRFRINSASGHFRTIDLKVSETLR